MNKKSIEQLEVGARVVIDTGSLHAARYLIREVTKITETQITVGGQRYNKRTGIRVGDGDSYVTRWQIAQDWPTHRLMSIEEAERRNREAEEEMEVKSLAAKISNVSFGALKSLPLETLQQVIKLLGLEE